MNIGSLPVHFLPEALDTFRGQLHATVADTTFAKLPDVPFIEIEISQVIDTRRIAKRSNLQDGITALKCHDIR